MLSPACRHSRSSVSWQSPAVAGCCGCTHHAVDDTDVFGVLLQPVVHVLADSVEVVQAGRLPDGPAALRHLQGWQQHTNSFVGALNKPCSANSPCQDTYLSFTTPSCVLESYSTSPRA